MTATYEGSLTLGQCIPAALDASAQLDASVNVTLADVQARVTALLELSVRPPPGLTDLIASAQAMLAALQALAANPLPDVSATAAALAELQATLAQLQASLAFSANLGVLLGTPGIHYFVYAGRADAFGSELGSLLSAGLPGGAGGAENVAGVVLLANDGGAISALQAVLRT